MSGSGRLDNMDIMYGFINVSSRGAPCECSTFWIQVAVRLHQVTQSINVYRHILAELVHRQGPVLGRHVGVEDGDFSGQDVSLSVPEHYFVLIRCQVCENFVVFILLDGDLKR